MPSSIPRTRTQLVETVTTSYAELQTELGRGGPRLGNIVCVDDWTTKQLLAVRCWWSEAVVDWIRTSRSGGLLDLPAPGYKWNETPRLNNDAAASGQRASYCIVRQRLQRAYDDVHQVIGELDDRELCTPGAFDWTGKFGLCGAINLNSARQYRTATAFIKRALKRREMAR